MTFCLARTLFLLHCLVFTSFFFLFINYSVKKKIKIINPTCPEGVIDNREMVDKMTGSGQELSVQYGV